MGDRLATIDVDRKVGGCCAPFFEGGGRAGCPSHIMWLGTRPTSVPSDILIHPTVWPQYTNVTTAGMGQKLRPVPLCGGTGSPSNTMSSVPRPTSVQSGILIHPAVRPQQTWAKNWGLCPFGKGELGPHVTQCGLS